MSGRRHSTPLFEIVSRNGNAGAPARPEHVPVVPAGAAARVEPKGGAASRPMDVPEEAAAARTAPVRESDGGELPRTMGRISVAGGTMRLPVNYVYIGLSVVLLAVLGTWTLAYFFGSKQAEERARREIESAAGGVREVQETGGSPEVRVPSGGGTASDNRGGGAEQGGPAGGLAPGGTGLGASGGLPGVTQTRTGFLAPGGFFGGEPRTAGLNYLCLVSRLPEADAARALEFLARNGVQAVGVENERSEPNNRVFALYTLVGLSREEYAGEGGSVARATHEALVAELGRRWKAEERGTSDFSRPQWYRFDPR